MQYYDEDHPELLILYVLEINRYSQVKSRCFHLTPTRNADRTVTFMPDSPYKQMDLRKYELGRPHSLEHDHPFEYHGFIIDRAERAIALREAARNALDQARLLLISDLSKHVAKLATTKHFEV